MTHGSDRMIGTKEGPIGWIIFNHPERRNAMSLDMWEALPRILDEFEVDPEIRVIVLRGADNIAFVSGADISEFETHRATVEGVARYEDIVEAATGRLAASPNPVIAMIQGFCIGGGLAIALACDIRIASPDSRFAIPAAKLGLGYRHGGIRTLIDVVGPAYAKEIFFTARQFTAAEAYEMGLVNRVVASPDLQAYTRDYCAMIAANAPMTIRAVKRTSAEIAREPADFDAELCETMVSECFASDDYKEGRRAFMEKRKPQFRGG